MTTSPAPAARRAATYRVQLHAGFTFDDAAAITGYLAALGVSHLYCSPYLQAAAGSTHGYDVVDHGRLNTELGGAAAHGRLVEQPGRARASARCSTSCRTTWRWPAGPTPGGGTCWKTGRRAATPATSTSTGIPPQRKLTATVLMPVLGDHYGRVLEAGELTVERQGGSFVVRYYDHEAPLSPRTLDDLLTRAAARAGSEELESLAAALGRLPACHPHRPGGHGRAAPRQGGAARPGWPGCARRSLRWRRPSTPRSRP